MRNALLFAVSVFILSACNEVDDVDRPTAQIVMPADNDQVWTADGVHISANLSDDMGLLQYKVVIRGIDSLNGLAADSTFALTIIDGIDGKPKEHYLDFTIALGDSCFNAYYLLTLTCLDAQGNEAYRDTVRFQLKNSTDPVPPVFNVTGPTPDDTLHVGDGFVLGGTVTDAYDLVYSDIFIGRTNYSDTVTYVTFPWVIDNTIDYTNVFNWWYPVDSTWTEGAYHVYYTARDNHSIVSHTIPFYVFH